MAANTGIINGGDIMLYRNTGTTESPIWTPIAHATEHTIETTAELRDRVSKSTGKWKGRKSGLQETTINVSALTCYDGESYFTVHELIGTKVQLKYSGRPTADVTAKLAEFDEEVGDKYVTGYFLIDKVGRNDAMNSDSVLTVSFKSDGEVSVATKS